MSPQFFKRPKCDEQLLKSSKQLHSRPSPVDGNNSQIHFIVLVTTDHFGFVSVRDIRNETVSLVSRRHPLNLAKSSFFLDQLKSKAPQSGQVSISGGGGCLLDQLKSKVPQSGQVFIAGGGVYSGPSQTQSPNISDNFQWGGGYSRHHIPQILEWGHSRTFEPKILVTGIW